MHKKGAYAELINARRRAAANESLILIRRPLTHRGDTGSLLLVEMDDAIMLGNREGKHQHPGRFTRHVGQALARCSRDLGDAAPLLRELRRADGSPCSSPDVEMPSLQRARLD